MGDPRLVAPMYGVHEREERPPDELVLTGVYPPGDDLVEEVTAPTELEDEVAPLLVVEGVIEGDDALVVRDGTVEGDLALDAGEVGRAPTSLTEDLHCDDVVVVIGDLMVDRLVDDSETARPEQLN